MIALRMYNSYGDLIFQNLNTDRDAAEGLVEVLADLLESQVGNTFTYAMSNGSTIVLVFPDRA